MTSAQRTIAEILAALILLGGGYAYWRNDVRQHAVLDFKLHATDSTAKLLAKKADTLAVVAAGAAQEAEKAKSRAMAQLAAGRAAQAKLDSTVRASANERDVARQVLADSAATVQRLRSEVGRLLSQSTADSASAADASARANRTIGALLATISADSLALSAEQSHSRSLEALSASLRKEVDLVKQSQPSKFGGIVKVVAWSAGAFVLGRVTK